MRNRKQTGYLYKRGGWWVLRYRLRVSDCGELKVVQRAKRLARVDAHHRNKASMQHLVDDALRPLNDRTYEPETVTTFGDFVERVYLPYVDEQRRASTAQGYRNKWTQYLKARCADWWMREVRTCDIQRVLTSIARESSLNRTTLRHLKALLSGIFAVAKQQGYFDGNNPVRDAAVPKAAPPNETYAYALEEVIQMLAALPEPAVTIVATAAFTGLRRSELRGLLWDHYNGQEIRVERSLWNGIASEPKTPKSKAPVPIIRQLQAMLDSQRQPSGPMFSNKLGKAICLNNLANRVIIPALNRCGTCRKVKAEHAKTENADHEYRRDDSLPRWHGWHAFRRGLATNLYRLGVPPKTIQAVLRHSNLQTTMNVYVKSVDADSVAAMQELDSLLCAKRALESASSASLLVN